MEETWAECEIIWWRGYAHGEFIAARFEGRVPIEAIRSQPVRWPGGHAIPKERPRVVSALAALAARLERDGWERVEQGDDWYAYRFRRRMSAHRDAAQVASTNAPHQLREPASQRVAQQAGEPAREELEIIEQEPVEPSLIEPEPVEPHPVEPDISEPHILEPHILEPLPATDEPWFAESRRTQPLSAQAYEAAQTVLVDRIGAYSVAR